MISPSSTNAPRSAHTSITFQPCSTICGQSIEHSDVHRAVRFSGEHIVFFTRMEYQLWLLLVAHACEHQREVSYTEIASGVFDCPFDDSLVLLIRKRMSAIRQKISCFGIDIINVPQRGYELRSLDDLMLPYRRGHRALVVRYTL